VCVGTASCLRSERPMRSRRYVVDDMGGAEDPPTGRDPSIDTAEADLPERLERRLFGGESRHLDRFGAVLILTIASVAALSLVDLRSIESEVFRGIAALVLSLTTGLSSALVGVMVAVALLPPTATFGILIGSGHDTLAWGAAFLLLTNIVCVALAANTVFFLKGIRPRTWIGRQKARQSWSVFVLLWSLILICVLIFLYLHPVR